MGIISCVNTISEETLNKVYDKLLDFNKNRSTTLKCDEHLQRRYYVSTGRKNVFYTLWVTGTSISGMRYNNYVCKLSTDFEKAVDCAMEILKNGHIFLEIDYRDTFKYDYNGTIMQFGKYKGEAIEDVAKKDINYLIWLNKNRIASKSKSVVLNYENIEAQVNLYFDTIRQYNLDNCKSEYIGEKGDKKKDFEFVIDTISLRKNDCGEFYISIEGSCGENAISIIINSSTNNFELVKDSEKFTKGSTVKISSAVIASNYVKLGRKVSRLKNVKFVG